MTMEPKSPEQREAGEHITSLNLLVTQNNETIATPPEGVCGQHTRLVQNENAIMGALSWLIRRFEAGGDSVGFGQFKASGRAAELIVRAARDLVFAALLALIFLELRGVDVLGALSK